jgi:Fe-S cluster assembly iron-binding protein IscA
MNFTEIASKMNKIYAQTKKLPVAVKVNSNWYNQHLQSSFILRNPNENPLEKMTGVPVHMDDSVATFEFVYDE